MASPVVEELVNATGRALTIKSAADRLLNSATPLLRRAMEQRASAAEAKARAASPATRAPVSSPEVETIDPVVPQQGIVEDSPQSLRSGPMVPQPQLQQQQRTNVGGVGVENRYLMRGDNAEERARMQAADSELQGVAAVGDEWRPEDATRIQQQFGVNIPPANPVARLEVSDASFQFRQDFLDQMEAKFTADTAAGKNTFNLKPLGELFTADTKFGDIIDDAWEVFRYYPSLKEIKVKPLGILDGLFGTKGAYDNKTKTMYLPRSVSNSAEELEDVRSTIIHEVQHYIQDVEGWARGGNTEEFSSLFKGNHKDFSTRKQKITRKYKAVVEKVSAIPEVQRFNRIAERFANIDNVKYASDRRPDSTVTVTHPRQYALEQIGWIAPYMQERFLSMSYDEMAKAFRDSLQTMKRLSYTKPSAYVRDVADEMAKILALKKSLEQYTGMQELIRLSAKVKKLEGIDEISYEGYKNLFGEIEARQTQARMNMTDEERAATPQEIMGYTDNDAIVRQQSQELKVN